MEEVKSPIYSRKAEAVAASGKGNSQMQAKYEQADFTGKVNICPVIEVSETDKIWLRCDPFN